MITSDARNTETEQRKKSANISKQQKEMLLEFINSHPKMLCCKFSSTFTAVNCRKLWEEITVSLNSVPTGTTKNWKAWRKTWQDLKSRTKTKSALTKRSANGTGGGPRKQIKLSNDEDSILQLIKPVSVTGLPDVSKSEVMEIEVPTELSSSSPEKRSICNTNVELAAQQDGNVETIAKNENMQMTLELQSQSQRIKRVNSPKKKGMAFAAVQGFEEYQNKNWPPKKNIILENWKSWRTY